MREIVEEILSDFVNGVDEPETTIDKLCLLIESYNKISNK